MVLGLSDKELNTIEDAIRDKLGECGYEFFEVDTERWNSNTYMHKESGKKIKVIISEAI